MFLESDLYLHDLNTVEAHDLVYVRLGGQKVPQQTQGLHQNVHLRVREKTEDLVCAEGLQNLRLDLLLCLERHVLSTRGIV